MKKLVLTLCATLFLISCNNELTNTDEIKPEAQVLTKSQIENATLKQKIAYKKYFLQEALKTVKEIGFKTSDILKLSKKVNAQKNTFILEDFIKLAHDKNMKISNEKVSKLKSLNEAFKNLDGHDYNISFYIPFADKLKATSSSINSRLEEGQELYIFEEQDIPDQTAFEGYVLNEDAEYVTYEQLITEELAEELAAENNTPVIVVGLQEESLAMQDIDGNVIDPYVATSSSSSSTTVTYGNKNFRIGNMTVKHHKESWIAGASEITVQMYKLENNNLQKINFINSSTAGGYSENIFNKFSRYDVRNQKQKSLNVSIGGSINDTPSVLQNTKLFYVIYEADNWPVPTREVTFPYSVNGNSLKIKFGSSDSEYYNSNSNANQIALNVDNAGIRFNPFLF